MNPTGLPRRVMLGAAWSACLALLPGCGDDPPEPLVTRYPLEAGWTWTYRRVIEVELLDGSSHRAQLLDSARVEAEGVVTVGEAAAFSVVSAVLGDGPPIRGQDYFQQNDRDLQHTAGAPGGADLDILPKPGRGDPAARPWAGLAGPAAAEAGPARPGPAQEAFQRTVLAFPLLTGNSWVMQDRPRVITRRVAAEERVSVPAGGFPTVRIETTIHAPEPLQYTDWIGENGLVRRELDWELEEYLFPGHPARERVRELIELVRYTRP